MGTSVAVCISGHLRSFRSTARSFRKHVLDPTGADVFVHTWHSINSEDPTWWSKDGDGARYHEATRDCLDEIERLYHPRAIVVEDSRDFHRVAFDAINRRSKCKLENVYSSLYSLQRANQIRKDSGHSYDVVIRCRADLGFHTTIELDRIRPGVLCCARHAPNRGLDVVGDLFVYGPPDEMNVFSDLVDHFDAYFMSDRGIHRGQLIPELALRSYLTDQRIPTTETDIDFDVRRINGDLFRPVVAAGVRSRVRRAIARMTR